MTTTVTKYRATIGTGNDTIDLGTYRYRTSAEMALGMEVAGKGTVHNPMITPVLTEVDESETSDVTDEDRMVTDELINFGRRDGESFDSVAERIKAIMRKIDGPSADEEFFDQMIEDARQRHGASRS